ncbi:MAG: NUDIX hydrolase [Dehalococcoidia bacterium]
MEAPRIRPIVLAVIRNRGRVLVFDGEDRSHTLARFCRPPGGGIEFGESSREALDREVREEIGCDIAAARLLGILENRFSFQDRRGHEVVFGYEVELARRDLYDLEVIPGDEGGTPMPLRWHDPAGTAVRLVPDGLRDLL